MKRKVNVIIPSSLSDVFESFIACNQLAKYERYTYLSPSLTRYKLSRIDLHGAVVSLYYNSSVECSQERRSYLLYCIASQLLDPIAFDEP